MKFLIDVATGSVYHLDGDKFLCQHAMSNDGTFDTSCESDACQVCGPLPARLAARVVTAFGPEVMIHDGI